MGITPDRLVREPVLGQSFILLTPHEAGDSSVHKRLVQVNEQVHTLEDSVLSEMVSSVSDEDRSIFTAPAGQRIGKADILSNVGFFQRFYFAHFGFLLNHSGRHNEINGFLCRQLDILAQHSVPYCVFAEP